MKTKPIELNKDERRVLKKVLEKDIKLYKDQIESFESRVGKLNTNKFLYYNTVNNILKKLDG